MSTTTDPIQIPPGIASALANADWDTLVRSMESALDGGKAVGILAIALAGGLVLWVNFRLARWIVRTLDTPRRHDPR